MKSSVLLNVVLALALAVVSVRLATMGRSQKDPSATDSAGVVYQNIMTRSSVRSYQPKPIEETKIEKLLRAGMAAPTAVNQQPWHFVVIRNRATLDKIAELTPNAGMVKEAPLAIVVCGDMNREKAEVVQMFWNQDVSAATENILLQAHAMGLGAVWTGLYPDPDRCRAISNLLNMPDNIKPFCTIVVGYPKGDTMPKDKWNPDNITYESF